MKHLLLFFLFSGSLDSFSQTIDSTLSLRQFGVGMSSSSICDTCKTGWVDTQNWILYKPKPDTLRATLIVYYDRGPAILHTKPGFVVRQWIGGDAVYLDDKKKAIKAPWEVFSYRLKK